jgi:hypothetical protein
MRRSQRSSLKFEHKSQSLLSWPRFLKRLMVSVATGTALIIFQWSKAEIETEQ